MAAPAISGLTTVYDISTNPNLGGENATSNPSRAYNSSGNYQAITNIDYSGNTTTYIELSLNASVDMTNKQLIAVISGTVNSNSFRRMGFRSGATANTNYKTWNFAISGGTAVLRGFYGDASIAGESTAGTFDITDVQALRIEWRHSSNQNNKELRIWSDIYTVERDAGLVLTEGEAGDQASLSAFDSFLRTAGGGYYTESLDNTSSISIDDFVQVPISVSIGDGVSPLTLENIGSAIKFTPNRDGATLTQMSAQKITINTPQAEVLQSLILSFLEESVTTDSGVISKRGEFEDASSHTNSYPGFLARNAGDLKLGRGNYTGTVLEGLGIVTGGNLLTLSFEDFPANPGNCVYQIDASLPAPTFSNSFFDSPLSDCYIDIPSGVGDGYTFDASGITFTTKPTAGNVFRTNVPSGETVTITAAAGSELSLADVEELGTGTTVVSLPQLTLTISALPTGAEVRIYDLDGTLPDFGTELAGTESISGTSFEWVHSKAGDDVFVQVFATGFKEFGETVRLLSISQSFEPGLDVEDSF